MNQGLIYNQGSGFPTALDTPKGVAWGPFLPTPGGSQHPKGPKESHPPAIKHHPCKHAHVRPFLTHCQIHHSRLTPEMPTRSSLERRRHTVIQKTCWALSGRPFPMVAPLSKKPWHYVRVNTPDAQRTGPMRTSAIPRGPGAQQPQPLTLHSNRGPCTPPE